jgi:dolichol-phosphate mannosyltransferase
MKLSVVIPVYNEARTLGELIARVRDVPLDKEIIIVDDGSNAATKALLREAIGASGIQLVTHAHNQGKGTAIRTGLAQATGAVVIFQDADLEYFPQDYVHLMEVYEQNAAQAVYGVRDLSRRSRLMRWGNRLMTTATNVLYGSKLHDMETCYKLVARPLLQSLALVSRGFEIEAEITAKLLRAGVTIHEAPIQYDPREEGKKLSVRDGLPTLWELVKHRFGHWL